jgi:hypothetical protein
VVTGAELRQLRAGFRGPVFRPGDDGYGTAITGGRGEVFSGFVWNGRFAGAQVAGFRQRDVVAAAQD